MSAPFVFTPEQETNIRSALSELEMIRGDWFNVANVLGISANTLQKVMGGRERIGPALTFRIAMAAHRPVDEVINGVPHGRCPTCFGALRRPLDAATVRPTGEEGDVT